MGYIDREGNLYWLNIAHFAASARRFYIKLNIYSDFAICLTIAVLAVAPFPCFCAHVVITNTLIVHCWRHFCFGLIECAVLYHQVRDAKMAADVKPYDQTIPKDNEWETNNTCRTYV